MNIESESSQRETEEPLLSKDQADGYLIVASDQSAPRRVRQFVRDLAQAYPFSQDDLERIETAVGEAVLNAVRHGSPLGPENQVTVHSSCNESGLIIDISDEGRGFNPEEVKKPDPYQLQSSGYGIALMRGMVDEVTFSRNEKGGTTVRLFKRFSQKRMPSPQPKAEPSQETLLTEPAPISGAQ
jgi:anti-sigma regulatory factor (Ser/Thr protein kinase)